MESGHDHQPPTSRLKNGWSLGGADVSVGTCRPVEKAMRLVLCVLFITAIGCSGESRPEPKSTVLDLFAAMRDSDSVSIRSLVDLESAVFGVAQEMPQLLPHDSVATPDSAAWLLGQLTGNGRLRSRWLEDNQIVVGRTSTQSDTALVEVSFLDRVTRVQYYNKMRLVFRTDHWVITDFRTL